MARLSRWLAFVLLAWTGPGAVLAAPGDEDLLSVGNSVQEFSQMSFGFVSANRLHVMFLL